MSATGAVAAPGPSATTATTFTEYGTPLARSGHEAESWLGPTVEVVVGLDDGVATASQLNIVLPNVRIGAAQLSQIEWFPEADVTIRS